jgi:hypothetical protein
MAFPGNYNINYYRGDTLEFRIYPKGPNGAPFDLSGYTSKFVISTSRGSEGILDAIECLSTTNPSSGHVTCIILPNQGLSLTPGITYVYDVQIKNSNYRPPLQDDDELFPTIIPGVFTLLTGTVTVTDDVSLTGVEI